MASLELAPEPASPGQARAFVRRLMEEWGVEAAVAEDAELLITELVTNAVIHAGTAVTVDVSHRDDRLHFSVSDTNTGQIKLRVPSVEAVTGRGIFLLDRLAPDWEVVPIPKGKRVRFSLSASTARSVAR